VALRSPEDARVAVRSFPRRFDELLAAVEGRDDLGEADVAFVVEQQTAAARALSSAAVALGGVASDVLAGASDELSAAITRRPADSWTDDVGGTSALAALDAAVTTAATALRAAEARAGERD
jgi:hypothetical protein